MQRLLDLQRQAGNAAVAGAIGGTVVQRQGGLTQSHVLEAADEADVPAVAEMSALRTEWAQLDARKKAATRDQPFSPEDAARLAEVNRLIGLRFKQDIALTLSGNSVRGGPAAWFADVKSHTFLGNSITVHDLLWAKLTAAETAFKQKVTDLGLQEPKGGWVRSTSSIRGPTEGLHGLGLAIDLNAGTNPYLINPSSSSEAITGEPLARSRTVRGVIDNAVLLVLGRTATEEDFGSQPRDADRATRIQASFDKLTEASGALKRYFELASPANRAELEALVANLGGKDAAKRTVAQWLSTIQADRAALTTAAGAKRWTNPEQGFFDLNQELVRALTNEGLTWLGDATVGSGRDIMHFDMRGLGPIHRIFKEGAWTNLGGD
jgi:hypothetical protein